MTRLIALPLVLGVGLLAVSATGADKLKVVTTIPDLADMTRQIGGDQVDVKSIATGVEDIHAVPMKPSFAVMLNRADAVVLLEIGRASCRERGEVGVVVVALNGK